MNKFLGFFFTSFFKYRKIFNSYFSQYEAKKVQESILKKIVEKNKSTKYFRLFSICDTQSFNSKCPIVNYDDIESYIIDIRDNNINNLCHDKVIGFSMSSGTTSRSKYIPVTRPFLNKYYRGGKDNLSYFFRSYPNSKILYGDNFSLMGTINEKNGYIIGDVSAVLYHFIGRFFSILKMKKLEYHHTEKWKDKLKVIVPSISKRDIRWMSGVPSWTIKVVDEVSSEKNASVSSLWENFEVFFYGGTSIKPFENKINSYFSDIKLWQIYNASEGIFGVQDRNGVNDMLLMIDNGVYYEFRKLRGGRSKLLNVNEIEEGEHYELIITNDSGLYRYSIGDIIEVTSLNPIRIKVIGRTKFYINTFGEELMLYNTETAVGSLIKQNVFISNYTVAPIVNDNGSNYHKWIIEGDYIIDNEQVEKLLDDELRLLNSDYNAKREDNMILNNLRIEKVKNGTLEKVHSITSKRESVQSKTPKLKNNTDFIDQVAQYLSLEK